MDFGALAGQVYEEITREKTGVLALLVSVAALIKTISEARKNSGDALLKKVQQNLLSLDLQDRTENRKEIEQYLETIRTNATALYNELDRVFKPFLHPEKLKPKQRDACVAAVDEFATTRENRPKIDFAYNALQAFRTDRADQPFERTLRATERFVANLSHGKCFLSELQQWPWRQDLPDDIGNWLDTMRRSHDELISWLGRERPTRARLAAAKAGA
jgi:hypothetical protein